MFVVAPDAASALVNSASSDPRTVVSAGSSNDGSPNDTRNASTAASADSRSNATSGVWNGELTITGPGGITETAPFSAYADPSDIETFPCQGDDQVLTDEEQECTPDVSIPADAPAGTWAVTSISLTNNAGQTQNYTGLDLAPITVTSATRPELFASTCTSTSRPGAWSAFPSFVAVKASGPQSW